MKIPTYLLIAALLAGCSQAPGNAETAKATTPEAERHAMTPSETPVQAAKPAMADGTVESVDVAAGKITIAHGPVDALHWPAMTMAFKATPEQLASVKAADKVHFEFTTQGTAATITRITPAK